MNQRKTLTVEEKIVRGLENFADALDAGEDLTKRFTCRKVVLDLEPVKYTASDVKKTRETLGVSQALFAKFLGASLSAVQAWERGEREAAPVACRFMDEIMHNPSAFRRRFIELATPAGSC